MSRISEFFQNLSTLPNAKISSADQQEIYKIQESLISNLRDKGCFDYSAFFYSFVAFLDSVKNLSNDNALGSVLENVKYVSQADVDAEKDVLTLTCKTLIDVLDHSEL
jgi:predicted metalloprotease